MSEIWRKNQKIAFGENRTVGDQPPDEYQRFVIEDVRRMGETFMLVYGGHVFGGIVLCLLNPNGDGCLYSADDGSPNFAASGQGQLRAASWMWPPSMGLLHYQDPAG